MRFSLLTVVTLVSAAMATGSNDFVKRQRPSVQSPTMSDGTGNVVAYNAANAGNGAAPVKAKRDLAKRQRPTVQTPVMTDGAGNVVTYDAAQQGAVAKARRSARK